MYLVDTDVMIDIQRGYVPALAWFASVPALPSIPSLLPQTAPEFETTGGYGFPNSGQLPQPQQYDQFVDSNQQIYTPPLTGLSDIQSCNVFRDPAVIYAEISGASKNFASMMLESDRKVKQSNQRE